MANRRLSPLHCGFAKEAGAAPARLLLLLALALGLFAAGCRSPQTPATGRFAAIEITGNTPGQIGAVTETVFRAHGYQPIHLALRELVFERIGTTMDQLTYGDWAGSTPVWYRVKLTIVPAGEATFRLECRAFLVRDRGQAIEQESKVSHLHHRPYQKLLDEVAARFRPHPG